MGVKNISKDQNNETIYGLRSGEVNHTAIAYAETLEDALKDVRVEFEAERGRVAGYHISFRGFEQPEYNAPEFK
jgi:hypothetical protein